MTAFFLSSFFPQVDKNLVYFSFLSGGPHRPLSPPSLSRERFFVTPVIDLRYYNPLTPFSSFAGKRLPLLTPSAISLALSLQSFVSRGTASCNQLGPLFFCIYVYTMVLLSC